MSAAVPFEPSKEDLEELWETLRRRLEGTTGMDLSGERERRLLEALRELVAEARLGSAAALLERLRDPRREAAVLERLVSHLTVGETFFFRNADHFRALGQRILPTLLADRAAARTLRIWSAGCATGEEPYSLSILLERDFPTLADWEVSILATDISAEFLARAEAGRYRSWSFRGTGLAGDPRFFGVDGDDFVLLPHLRRRVRFRLLNLVTDIYPSPLTQTIGLDLILFRNVAIYLKESVTQEILRRFALCLRPGGMLLLGEAETRPDLFDARDFEEVHDGESVFLRRKSGLEAHAFAPILPFRPRAAAATTPAAPPAAPPPSTAEPSPLSPLDRARSALSKGSLVEARVILEESLKKNPLQIDGHLLFACIAEETGDLRAAALSLRRAIYLDPETPLPHFWLGIVLHRADDAAGSSRAFRNARELAERFSPEVTLPHGEGLIAGRFLQILDDLVGGAAA